MLDLGRSFIASVARDPDAPAIVDGDLRLTYAQWYARISSLVASFDVIELKSGDHLITALQNCWQAATVHWACQLAGVIITPVNWRAKADELDFCIENSEARAVIYQDISVEAAASSKYIARLPFVFVGGGESGLKRALTFDDLISGTSVDAAPCANADAWSIMLYTSGTTSRPKGVPRRHRAERAAAVAHVAQNLYSRYERTLGVMPLYHTMGVRSLIAMSLVGGVFVCLPRYDTDQALKLIEAEKITNLYLVPTLYHDLVYASEFAATDVSSVRRLGFAGAPMTDGLLKTLEQAFRPDLFVNHYGSSEIYTFTVNPDAPKKPGSAGKAGINQHVRVVRLGATSPADVANTDEEGQIIALLASDEAFEGYWRRPDADAKALREGWYFTGDTGFVDRDGDLFVTGRVDDMIITGARMSRRSRSRAACHYIRRCSKSPLLACPMNAGARLSQPSSSAKRQSANRSSSNSVVPPDWRISSVRGASSSLTPFRSPRLESCCGVCSSQGNTTLSACDHRIQPDQTEPTEGNNQRAVTLYVHRSTSRQARRLPGGARRKS
jgi:2-furoate---CoA ligase